MGSRLLGRHLPVILRLNGSDSIFQQLVLIGCNAPRDKNQPGHTQKKLFHYQTPTQFKKIIVRAQKTTCGSFMPGQNHLPTRYFITNCARLFFL
jgi:hypothetical protein